MFAVARRLWRLKPLLPPSPPPYPLPRPPPPNPTLNPDSEPEDPDPNLDPANPHMHAPRTHTHTITHTITQQRNKQEKQARTKLNTKAVMLNLVRVSPGAKMHKPLQVRTIPNVAPQRKIQHFEQMVLADRKHTQLIAVERATSD